MRKLTRADLPKRTCSYLSRKQKEVDDGAAVEPTWKNARSTKAMGSVMTALNRMTGKRCRRMYCEDSRGTDIDHFWPKARYKERTFVWKNLLLACAGCNRKKGSEFLLDESGAPLLIDPTSEDPWDYLYFDDHTGQIVAAYEAETGLPSPKGEHTTDPDILPLNIEAVAEGRSRTARNLCRAANAFLRDAGEDSGVSSSAYTELRNAIQDNDNYGLASWYFTRGGRDEEPFSQIVQDHPRVYAAIVSKFGLQPE